MKFIELKIWLRKTILSKPLFIRIFCLGTTSTATTPNNSLAGVDLTIEEQAGGPNSLFRTSWSGQPSGGRDSVEGALEDVEEELSLEEDEETMDLGDE